MSSRAGSTSPTESHLRTLDQNSGTGPDWQLVHFDVGCARCGHDLRGLIDPTCPACSLEFDWSEAVPVEALICDVCKYHLYGLLETRCPECGTAFTWEGALEAHHRRKHPLFEYQCRRRPIRSFLTSCFSALRPAKLWRRVDIHDRPPVNALLLMALVSIVVTAVLTATLSAVFTCVDLWWGPRMAWYPNVRAGLVMQLVWERAVSTLLPSTCFFAGWLASSFAALMIFRQSMRRYRVRTQHVVRVWSYAVVMVLPLTTVVLWGIPILRLLLHVRGRNVSRVFVYGNSWWGLAMPLMLEILGAALCLFLVVRSIRHGYGSYLRMPHGWAVAIASQVIAVLAVFTVFIFLQVG